MTPIPTIACDIGNVIINADHEITYQVLVRAGVASKNAKTFFENNEYQEFSRGRMSAADFCKALNKKYLRSSLSDVILEEAHNQHMTKVNWDVLNVLKGTPHTHLLFLTDTNLWQTQREQQLIDLKKYSQTIIRSHEIHMLKSDNEYFARMSHMTGLSLQNFVLIDDNQRILQIAQGEGLQTVPFTTAQELSSQLHAILT
ncbi:MAG: hypothetical protein AAB515_04220 [Patescibacteria group bacterium]